MNDISTKSEQDYAKFLNTINNRLKMAQLKLAYSVNLEIIKFYWGLGKDIAQTQACNTRWGTKLLDQLSHDLQNANPGMKGFSRRNLEYMRLLAKLFPAETDFKKHPIAQLPWSHIQLLIDKFKNEPNILRWYANEALVNGWSRSTLNTHIKSKLYERESCIAEKMSNHRGALPSPQSDLAHEMLKNPYSFDFLTVSKSTQERDIENALTTHIESFLLGLRDGFSFVGNQVPIEIDGENYFIDLLFYHYKLRSFVVCKLKATKLAPRDIGQLNFYLNAVDNIFRQKDDNPTIGILLCESRSKIVAEYALKNTNAPIGASEYTLSKALPKELKARLPSIKEIEAELNVAVKQTNDGNA